MKLETYRHYLQSEFENRRTRNPSYSLRAFARDLEMSPSRLSEAVNGKRGISSEIAAMLVRAIGLDGIDAEIFLLSVEAEHSRSEQRKLAARGKLKALLSAPDTTPKTFTIVDWVAEALLKMNEREPVTDGVAKAAEKLGIPFFMAEHSLRFLTRLGFIAGAKNFKTYLQNRGKGRRLNVDYTQVLDQAHKAYASSVSENHFMHQVFLLEKKDQEKASRILQSAVDEIRRLETKSKKSKVVFIATQIFSVEREGK